MPTDSQPLGLLVLGSGPAGVSAAAAYLEAGGPGPVCLLTADTDPPYQRPPLSKTVLSGEEPAEATPILEDDAALGEVDVRLRSRVAALDLDAREVRTEAGERFGYERLVVATGSEPVDLPGVEPGAEVHSLRSLEHSRGLTRAAAEATTALVIGSGFIGCEAAASLAGRGVRTTLVTPEPAPQAERLGARVGARLTAWLEEAGVEVRTEVSVERVEAPHRVSLDDGSVLEPDLVLVAVGVDQEQPFLTGSGLVLEDGHLRTTSDLRTSDDRVWAAGDVARAHHAVAGRALSVEHWGDALSMGELAGQNAAATGLGGTGVDSGEWSDPPGFWSQVGSHTLKYAAWGDGWEEERLVEHGDAFSVWYADAAGELVGVLTHGRDEDYDRGGELLARRATLEEALQDGGGE